MNAAETGAAARELLRAGEAVGRVVPKLLLSYDEACWSMGLCERTLRNMVADGRLPAIKIGGRTLFSVDDLQAVVQAHRAVRDGTIDMVFPVA